MRWLRSSSLGATNGENDSRGVTTNSLFGRLLSGWTLVLPSVGIALVAALLAFPQPSLPGRLPRPVIQRGELTHDLARLAQQARDAETHQLPYKVRAVGEALRQFGRRTYEEPRSSTEATRERWREQLGRVLLTEGDLPLLRLRAVQAKLFADALARWEKTHLIDSELIELGGDFLPRAKTEGWIRQGRLLANREERLAMFVMRFTELAGLRQKDAFRVPRAIELLTLRFRLQHPTTAASTTSNQLAVVERIGALAPDYPVELVKGMVLTQSGNFTLGAQAFERQLGTHGNGPWTLWARDYLLFARTQNAGHSLP
jgi:hypothetical protein